VTKRASDALTRIFGHLADHVESYFDGVYETKQNWVEVYRLNPTTAQLKSGFEMFLVTNTKNPTAGPVPPLDSYSYVVILPSRFRRLSAKNRVMSGNPLRAHNWENHNLGMHYSTLKDMVRFFK
jgi:hypothetical protein